MPSVRFADPTARSEPIFTQVIKPGRGFSYEDGCAIAEPGYAVASGLGAHGELGAGWAVGGDFLAAQV